MAEKKRGYIKLILSVCLTHASSLYVPLQWIKEDKITTEWCYMCNTGDMMLQFLQRHEAAADF